MGFLWCRRTGGQADVRSRDYQNLRYKYLIELTFRDNLLWTDIPVRVNLRGDWRLRGLYMSSHLLFLKKKKKKRKRVLALIEFQKQWSSFVI